MFVNKGKINTSRSFSYVHHEESPEKPQYNMATPSFLDKPPHFTLPAPFSSKIFQTPHLHQFSKSRPPHPPTFVNLGTFDIHRIPLVLPMMIILYLFFKRISEKRWQNLNQRGDIGSFLEAHGWEEKQKDI